jgi:alcohol dehydrogenase class IV
MGIRRLLLVSDPYFVKTGQAQKVATAAKADAVEIFDRVEPDPSVTLAAEGAAVVREFRPDMIAALGGGSAIDCAKAMGYFGGCTRFVAIPTTSGSGSEVTDFAIITKDGIKQVLVDESLQPDAAILDDSLLAQLPAKLVADGGFDVLSHALEALASNRANPLTDALARDSFCTVLTHLEASFRGDISARMPVHTAATMAGLAFTGAGLGLCHAMAHALGGVFHIPHGRLNGILLPWVVEYNAPAAGDKYTALARQAGLGGSARVMGVRNLKNALLTLRNQLQMPASLAQAGVPPREVYSNRQKILDAVLNDPCCKTNPVPVTRELAGKVLDQVTGIG